MREVGWQGARLRACASRLAHPAAAVALVAGLTAAAAPNALGREGAHGARRSGRQQHAHAARSVKVDDNAHLHLVKTSGAVLYEHGSASGTLPGATSVRMVISSHVKASFTIDAQGGSISGTGSAGLKSTGRYASFGGSLKVTKGTGRYSGAHGKGGLYGVYDRRTHAVTVKTKGTLYY
jgi:hypothetical protein